MVKDLIRVKNEHGAEFVITRKHYEDHHDCQNLTYLGKVLLNLSPDYLLLQKTAYYIHYLFPAGGLYLASFGNWLGDSAPVCVEYLQKLKRDFSFYVCLCNEEENIKSISKNLRPLSVLETVEKLPNGIHWLLLGTPSVVKQLGDKISGVLDKVTRGGLLIFRGLELKDENHPGLEKWEHLHLRGDERVAGIELFRRLV